MEDGQLSSTIHEKFLEQKLIQRASAELQDEALHEFDLKLTAILQTIDELEDFVMRELLK